MKSAHRNQSHKGIKVTSQASCPGPGDFSFNMARYQSISDLVSNFTWKLQRALGECRTGNFAFSPITTCSAVFVALLGSDGITRDELSKIVVTGGNDDHFTEEFNRIFPMIKEFHNNNEYAKGEGGGSSFQFSTIQRVFHSIGDCLIDEYLKLLQSTFEIDCQTVDFTTRGNTLRKIRVWLESAGVKSMDNSSLQDALQLDALNRLFYMAAVTFTGVLNVDVYFSHQESFFYVNNTERVATRMLGCEQEMDYAVFPHVDARAVSIPFVGDRCLFMLFLPKGKNGLRQLEHSLRNYATLSTIVNGFQAKKKLHFFMPYFKVDGVINFNDALKQLGASSMFDPNQADFGRMEEIPEHIFVSGLIQKVQFDIFGDEELLKERSAGCGFDTKYKLDEQSLEFHVEHPFFYMVYDKISKIMLVSGRIVNPLEHSGF